MTVIPLDIIARKCTEIITSQDDTTVYTDIGHQYRMERYIRKLASEEDLPQQDVDFLLSAKWLEGVVQAENPMENIDFEKAADYAYKKVKDICSQIGIDDVLEEQLATFVSNIGPDKVPLNKMAKVMSDATWMDYASNKGRDYLRSLYQQLLLKGHKLERLGWYDVIINFLSNAKFYTEYGKTNFEYKIDKLILTLNKEKKQLSHRQALAIKEQLNISEGERKKLKKDLMNVRKRDDRGIQTLFRTTLRNHYTLNQMVDRKANIMITVNSIILSLLVGGIISTKLEGDLYRIISMGVLSLACMASIFFAVLSIRPNKTQGDFTEEEIRNKQGNLLYFGNFHNMHVRDFEWAFMQMLNDSDYLYGSLIRDFYFLGVTLSQKYKHMRFSLNIFLFGFFGAVILNVILRFFI